MRDETIGAQRDSVDLRSILECVVDEAGAGAELAAGAPVAVTVDVLGMQRVFENLVDNALKYGTAARVTLSVQAGEAVVEVADDGPGLAPEELEQVFKPFYRSHEASGKAGMGLGLAVSRSTVRAHGGELILKPGAEGLIAQVRLPAAVATATAIAA
jgi:two-component system OmpR family sensor kinase